MNDKSNSLAFTLLLTAELEDDELQALTLKLRNELLDANVEFADIVMNREKQLSGAKSADSVTLGAIVLGVTASTLPNVIILIQNWLLRQRDQTIRIKIGEVEVEVPRDISQAEINNIIRIIETIPQ